MERPPGYDQVPPSYEAAYGPRGIDDEDPDTYAGQGSTATAAADSGPHVRLLQGLDDYRPPPTPHRTFQPSYQPSSYQPSSYRQASYPPPTSYNSGRSPSPLPSRLPQLQFDASTSSLGLNPSELSQPASPPGYASYAGGSFQTSPTRAYAASPGRSSAVPGYAQYSRASSRSDNRSWSAETEEINEGRGWDNGATSGDWQRTAGAGYYDPADMGIPRPATSSSVMSESMFSGGSRRPLPQAPGGGRVRSRQSGMSGETMSPHHGYDYDDNDTESESGDEMRSECGDEESSPSLDVGSVLERPFSTSGKSLDSEETSMLPEVGDEKNPEMVVRTKGENFGPAPLRPQARRGLNRQALMTRKQVKLINGELILDNPIPSILHSFLPRRDDKEFTHMRYTAVTCDPDHFVERGYLLRQNLESTRRETELFVCITMYNEDENCFTRTMHGVMRNIAHFCSRSKSRVWGKDGWQKIVVAIVADGRKKVHPRVLDALAAMGVYQPGIAKNVVNGRPVVAHLYEYTTQVSLDSDMKFKGAEKGIVPVQMVFCMKERNQKKLNSHRWFFNGFGRSLQPNVCILLDVGTRPGANSLYHLWKAFDRDSQVGGACGEIKAMKGRGWLGLFNPLVASQNFEYKMSNILDKPLESVFGYITVLPGALSAYRYHALQNDEQDNGPLAQYFKGEDLKGKDADVFTANMYLAEDRILCWELVAKRSERWVLKYVRSATGETDVPDAVPEFISQRRRWLNGAFFAAIYSLVHFRQVWESDHTLLRKVLLHAEFVYQAMSLMFTFFSLANFYLSFYFIAGSLSDSRLDPFGSGWGNRIFVALRFLCVLLICTQFILCMGNRPQGAKRMFKASMVLYGIIMAYTTFCGLYIVIKSFTGGIGGIETSISFGDNIFTNLIVSTGSTMGVYFLCSFLYCDPWHMFTSSAQYFLMLPSYLCTLQIYAFCNTHDVSWGTKGADETARDLGDAVATKAKGDTVELEMPSEQLDIDSGYDEALRNLRDRLEVPKEGPTEEQRNEDYYRAFRTYVVVVWMISNAILAMIVTEVYEINDVGGNSYLKFILWSVAALAVYRMFGSLAYLTIQALTTFVEGKVKLDPDRIRSRFQPAWKRRLGIGRKGPLPK